MEYLKSKIRDHNMMCQNISIINGLFSILLVFIQEPLRFFSINNCLSIMKTIINNSNEEKMPGCVFKLGQFCMQRKYV